MNRSFNFDRFFELDTTDSYRKKYIQAFKKYWLEHGTKTSNGNIRVPDEYLEPMQKIMSYRIDSPKAQVKLENMEHLILGLDEYKHYTFMFYEKSVCEWIKVGCIQGLRDLQAHNQKVLKSRQSFVVCVLRNIAYRYRIYDMKSKLKFPMYSDLSGCIIRTKEDAEIDHYDDDFAKVAFDCLYDWKQQWIAKYHTPIVDIFNIMYDHIDTKNEVFKEDVFNEAFIKFHDSHTHLRVISRDENRKREKFNPDWRILRAEGYYVGKQALHN